MITSLFYQSSNLLKLLNITVNSPQLGFSSTGFATFITNWTLFILISTLIVFIILMLDLCVLLLHILKSYLGLALYACMHIKK